jgi:hypothetical protein
VIARLRSPGARAGRTARGAPAAGRAPGWPTAGPSVADAAPDHPVDFDKLDRLLNLVGGALAGTTACAARSALGRSPPAATDRGVARRAAQAGGVGARCADSITSATSCPGSSGCSPTSVISVGTDKLDAIWRAA